MASYPKIVESVHYHLWTDALHARALAQQTHNRWDRGTYVRWAVGSAWTCLELACDDALNTHGTGNDFKRNVNAAIAKLGLSKLNWGDGIWQQVLVIHQLRKDYTHPTISQDRLFSDVDEADKAITTIKAGIDQIYCLAGKTPPEWINDDSDRGWDSGNTPSAHGYVSESGASMDDPNSVRVVSVEHGQEYIYRVLPEGTDPEPRIYDLLRGLNIPIQGVRVYQCKTLLIDRPLNMRGS